MEQTCKELIVKLGMESYLPEFEAASFHDCESVESLAFEPEILEKIIEPLGHRAKFLAKLKDLKKNENFVKCQFSTDSKEKEYETESLDNIEPDILNKCNSFFLRIERDVEGEKEQIKKDSFGGPENNLDISLQGISDPSQIGVGEESRLEDNSDTQQLKGNILNELHPERSNAIVDILNSTVEGKLLIKLYETKGFDNKSRIRLAACVIHAEYGQDTNKVILTSRFKELAKEIAEAFPTEIESTYYVPSYTPKGAKTLIAKGKLYDKYTSFNKELRDAYLREKRPGRIEVNPELLLDENIEGAASIEAYLKFLERCLEPWDTVVEYWKITSTYRTNELLKNITHKENIFSYFDKYGCLKQPKGYTLLEIDFNKRFPDSSLRIFSHWPPFANKLKKELAKQGIDEFESEVDLLHKFIHLFSVIPIKVPKGKAWRASRAEITQGLMLHLKVISDFEKENERITSLAASKGFCVQPFSVVVGDTLKDIHSSYVVIDGKPIRVECPLRALEITFKSYFALNCEYPMQSQRQWVVLQKTLFNVHVPYDRTSKIANLPEVKRLVKTLNC